MAVEKMKIVGLIGDKSLVSKALRLIVLNGNMHFINALTYVNSHEFALIKCMLPFNTISLKALLTRLLSPIKPTIFI
ncbi:MAG TPA: hypothetical protein GX534_07260, partial [Thermoanaerobacterales bacterium]|nr:hypothetical protein [Thermoanaerobacterales bacterium]